MYVESIAEILRAGRQLSLLIDDLDQLSALQQGTLPLRPARVGLNEIMLASVAALEEYEGIGRSRYEVHPCAFAVRVDRALFQRCLVRSLATAARFNANADTLHLLGLTSKSGCAVVGIGPSVPEIERHFDSLLREGPLCELSAAALDTGIVRARAELSIVSHALSFVGGDAIVRRGARDTSIIYLSLKSDDVQGARGMNEGGRVIAQTSGELPRYQILYIEDHAANQRLIKRLMERVPGVRLAIADTASGGLNVAREIFPNLILLDVRLPDKPGLDLIAELRALPGLSDVPVIVLSASATRADEELAMARGATYFMSKPIDGMSLIRLVCDLQDSARHR